MNILTANSECEAWLIITGLNCQNRAQKEQCLSFRAVKDTFSRETFIRQRSLRAVWCVFVEESWAESRTIQICFSSVNLICSQRSGLNDSVRDFYFIWTQLFNASSQSMNKTMLDTAIISSWSAQVHEGSSYVWVSFREKAAPIPALALKWGD